MCLNRSAENQLFRIRELFLRSVLHQNLGWFDTHQTSDFASRATENLHKLQDGIGEKVAMFCYAIGTGVSCLATAFSHTGSCPW